VLPSFTAPEFCDFQKEFAADQLKERFSSDVTYTIERLNACQGQNANLQMKDIRAIRDLEVCDFIEVIAAEAVGGENVYAFFQRCFV
jgi:hypothetical protein